MRVKITKDNEQYTVGVVYDLDDPKAIDLCEAGVAVPVREREDYERAVAR